MLWILTPLLFLLTTTDAHAYIGPGPGLSMLGSLLALIGVLFAALLMIVIYPLRIIRRRRKARKTKDSGDHA